MSDMSKRSLEELKNGQEEPRRLPSAGPSAFDGAPVTRSLDSAPRGADRTGATALHPLQSEEGLRTAFREWASDESSLEAFLRTLGQGFDAMGCDLWVGPTGGATERCEHRWRDPHAPAPQPNGCDTSVEHAAPLPEPCELVEWIEHVERDARVCGDAWMQRNGVRALLRAPVRSGRESFGSLRIYWRESRPRDVAAAEFVARFGELLAQHLLTQRASRTEPQRREGWRALLSVTPDAVVAIDRLGRVVELNEAAALLLERGRDEILNRALIEVAVPERLRKQAAEGFEALRARGERSSAPVRFSGFVRRSQGAELPVDVALAGFDSALEDVRFVVATPSGRPSDVAPTADKVRAHLRSLMTALLVAEERERLRLAQDLHDGLSQTLALAQMKLASIRTSGQVRSVAVRESLRELHELIVSADRSARSVGFELSPPSLHQLGLGPALLWLVENLHLRYGIVIDFDDGASRMQMDETRRVIMFRAIRELLINSAKHSGASSVRLTLRNEADRLLACVADEGVGMPEGDPYGAGTSLRGIQERLAHVCGQMRVRSTPGRGTTIELDMPLSSHGPNETRDR